MPFDIEGARLLFQVMNDCYEKRNMVITTNAGSEGQRLPKADVLEFALAGACKLIVRPSGTEPKVKAYAMACADSAAAAADCVAALQQAARQLLTA